MYMWIHLHTTLIHKCVYVYGVPVHSRNSYKFKTLTKQTEDIVPYLPFLPIK